MAFGGHKGVNLALMVELLAAAVTASPFAAAALKDTLLSEAPTPPLGGMVNFEK